MERETMDAEAIGAISGRIWNYLAKNGSTTLIQMKSDLNEPTGVIYLGLGWLLREDKISLNSDHGQIKIRLKA